MTLSALLLSLALFTSSAEIVSVDLAMDRGGDISFTEGVKEEIQVQKPHRARVVIVVEREDSYVLTGGMPYLRNMTFYDSAMNRLGAGNDVELLLKRGRSVIYISYPFLDPKEDEGVSISLKSSSVYYKEAIADQRIKTGFLVIVFFLFVLSMAFYIVGRRTEIIYLEYALYLLSVYYFFAYQYGFFGYYFEWVNHIHPLVVWISSASITITYIIFMQSFLHLKQTDPLLMKVLNYGIGFVFFIILSESVSFWFGFDLQHAVFFSSFSLSMQLGAMIFCLYRIYKLKSTLSRIALLGASILVTTTLFGQLASTLKLVDQTNYFVMAALTLEIFIFNIGIGIRMVLMNKERAKAQYRLIDQMKVTEQIQKDQHEQLEIAVEQRTDELAKRNRQNELLLSEIHHRVKNNLQTISSLLSIQQRKLNDKATKSVIAESKSRVIAMGLIHEHLYKNASFAEINFAKYLEELVQHLVQTYSTENQKIDLDISVEEINLDVEKAIHLGLIINELVNNSIKHAFDGLDAPKLTVTFGRLGSEVKLSVHDNGDKSVGDLNLSASFGWKIVNSLCEKLRAKLEVSESNGLLVQVKLDADFVIPQIIQN